MMTRAVWLSAALLCIGTQAFAADQVECGNSATQMAMNECVGRNMKAADEKLNQTYRALLAKVSKDGAEQLRKSQRAWVAWRDAQCDFDTMSSRTGSIHSAMQGMCIEQLTRDQTKHLDSQLHCQEGDMSCGGQ
jgi:uncharacterized protein YecT (DUF1311 family)